MTVSKSEVDQMANFMRALNEQQDDYHHANPSAAAPGSIPVTPVPIGAVGGIQEMKTILERFHHAAGDAVIKVNHEARNDRELREALVTERTDRGARIGAWNIEMRRDGKQKFYSVVQEDGITCIASDLLLYEAAQGLVRILNNGGRLNSSAAINLLKAEQDYAGALNDAVLYKHYLVKHPHDRRSQVFEAKYSAATRRAISAREKVYMISEQR